MKVFFVITGGPGSGKTTLIDALEQAGFARTVEAGRGVIQDQVAIDGPALPWRDPAAFAELMLGWEMRSYRMATQQDGPVFFDRGVPDVIGYLRLMRLPVPPHLEAGGGGVPLSPPRVHRAAVAGDFHARRRAPAGFCRSRADL